MNDGETSSPSTNSPTVVLQSSRSSSWPDERMACQSWTSVASTEGARVSGRGARESGGGIRSASPVPVEQNVAWTRASTGLTPSTSSRPRKAGYMWREKCWKPVSMGIRAPPRSTMTVWACPPT